MDEAASTGFTPWALPAKVDIAFRSTSKTGTSPNVIGVLKGSDPTLAAEAVVFSAHYDAYGKIRGAIYNGAADNAIGVAEMLAVAEAFAKAKQRPRRSLVFIAFTSEEYGMSGSRYDVEHPTWDLTKTAAVLNLDGIGTEIMGPMKSMVAYGAPFSSLGALTPFRRRGSSADPTTSTSCSGACLARCWSARRWTRPRRSPRRSTSLGRAGHRGCACPWRRPAGRRAAYRAPHPAGRCR
jgi:hypothetical protein